MDLQHFRVKHWKISKDNRANSETDSSDAGWGSQDNDPQRPAPDSEAEPRRPPRAKIQKVAVPKELIKELNASRPLCIFYSTRKGCNKGKKCPQRHLILSLAHACEFSFVKF